MSSESKAEKAIGFGPLYCPNCHEGGATISLDLNELAEFECKDCDSTFGREDIRDRIDELWARLNRWEKVLAWLETAPAND